MKINYCKFQNFFKDLNLFRNISSFRLAIALALFVCCSSSISVVQGQQLVFEKGDHVTVIGNTMADRMQHHAWLETYIHHLYPEKDLTFRNLGFSGDELKTRPRSANFGSPAQWLTKCESDVIFAFFGYNESLKGVNGIPKFEKDLASVIDEMLGKKYNGESSPKIVFFSPIAHENLNSRHLPDGSLNNKHLAAYTAAMKKVCQAKSVGFVDLFAPSKSLYKSAKKPMTMNGIHLLDHGNQAIAKVIVKSLFEKEAPADKEIAKLREVVLEKNYEWFSRYRVVDGYNVYGGRSKLAWHGQSNADVMRREMEIFDVKTANRDKRVWAVAKGGDLTVTDDNLPKEVEVKTNKPGKLPGEKWAYLEGNDAIKKMTIHKNMEVNLFASEKEFPRLVNPVQMSVDTDSRLWVSVWPSYPHWNPTEKPEDALLIFPDEDGDGKADECKVFADGLNSVTGFEFWNGGVLVAAPPEIWFLKDTDGDDKADVKIRMLQGISSADTHHSANAMLVGPDGWLYWSRGVFNVANFETPTKTYRSGATGVHRFNPRTFEVEFHFPIGPNPHGDVFDQWGYQFANDGTGGTGSYINIGKGQGNKKWFKKRVRPVPATGILSSGHFPPEHEGNFLIANAITVLGVLQHKVQYEGADITATEIEPIVTSDDPNFRPSDMEVGGDGALYISDWHNTLIGHMQHNMRDPNRDHEHGRIYRVTYKGRDLLKPAKMKGKPIAEVCENFFALENNTRYHARLELTSRSEKEIIDQVGKFAAKLDPKKGERTRNEAQALLESLWVFEEQRIPNMELLAKTFQADEARVRAAAIRTLGHWAPMVHEWKEILVAAARDKSPLVRAEAVKAAVDFGEDAIEVIFEVANRDTDPELQRVLKFASGRLSVDAYVKSMIQSGKKLSVAGQTYVLRNASIRDLVKMEPSEGVYRAILSRDNASTRQLSSALTGLAKATKESELNTLMSTIKDAKDRKNGNLIGLGKLLVKQPVSELGKVKNQIEEIALNGDSDELRQLGFAAWVAAAGPGDTFLAATKSKERLRTFLEAIPLVDPEVRGQLYSKVLPLISEMPSSIGNEADSGIQQSGINVEYYYPSGSNVAMETLDKMTPKAVGVVPEIVMNVPQLVERDKFALRFQGMINIREAGKYRFFVASDDGSRIYLDDKLFINNDGQHGMVEKSASVDLSAGSHKLVVTYFDNGGGDGLNVAWSGPGFKKQKIKPEFLMISGGETLHDVAINALSIIPGNETEKFQKLSELVATGKHRTAAIATLSKIDPKYWPPKSIQPLADNLIGFLSGMPARFRTSAAANSATQLAKSLAAKLPDSKSKEILDRLQNLDVRVIAIGTVPHRMIFDKELIAVQAGKPVEFRFSNTDSMPHNFAIAMPGSLSEVGELAEATGRQAEAQARGYIPKSNKILLGSKLLEPGESQSITFEVPTEPGIYPYVCTYPGHWRRMFGALYVVDNLEAYQADSEAYLADNPLMIKDDLLKLNSRNREWKIEELLADVKAISKGRSFEVGKELFKQASCTGCHQLNNEGRVFGPDLAKLDSKRGSLEKILESIVEPSKEIDEKFQSNLFTMLSGKTITGMIVEETDKEFKIVIDPLAKDKATILLKDDIDDYSKAPLSMMPTGLLSRLTQEEILDLIAYVYAKGDKKSKLFMENDAK